MLDPDMARVTCCHYGPFPWVAAAAEGVGTAVPLSLDIQTGLFSVTFKYLLVLITI